jgi:hypothetical protein
MKPPECAHAFQTNKTALSALGINRRTMLDTLGTQLNLSAIVDGINGNWNCHFLLQLVKLPAPNNPVIS